MKKVCIVLICFLVACTSLNTDKSTSTDRENGTVARSK